MTHPMNSTSQNTASFLQAIRSAPNLPLEFHLSGQPLVPAGYHVTEFKALSIRSVDCGGAANDWQETIVQLMDGTPEEAERGFITTRKFMAIYSRVAPRLQFEGSAEIRFEYGSVTAPALQYHLSSVTVEPGRVVVDLTPPGVTCKASGASSRAGECCGPSCAPVKPQLTPLG